MKNSNESESKNSKKEKSVSIFKTLKAEHEDLKDLLEKTEEADPSDREHLLEKVCQALMPHARAEEKTLYALFRIRALEEDKEMLDLANEGYEEHLVVDGLIESLKELNTDDERWIPMFKVLKDNLEHHIDEEESEIFKGCKKVLSKEEQSLLLDAYLASKETFSDHLQSQSQIDERTPSKEVESMLNS